MSKEYSLVKKTEELRKLILGNPDLPIVVLAGQDANCGDYGWTYCSSIGFGIGEILDCDFLDADGLVYRDRDDFENDIANYLAPEYEDESDEKFEKAVQKEIDKYEPYWKKVIAIYVDN